MAETKDRGYDFNYYRSYNGGKIRAIFNHHLRISRLEVEGGKKSSFHIKVSVSVEDFSDACKEDSFSVLVNVSSDEDYYSQCFGYYNAPDSCTHTEHTLVDLQKIREEQVKQAKDARGEEFFAYSLNITAGVSLSIKRIGKDDHINIGPVLQLQSSQARL